MNQKSEYYIEIVNSVLKQADNASAVFLNELTSDDIAGKYISALANQAALDEKPYAYALWGIDNSNLTVVGTDYYPSDEITLSQFLSTNAVFSFESLEYHKKKIVLLEVQCATNTTIQYKGDEYIFSGSSPEKLSKFPQKEKCIWKNLDEPTSFESKPAMENVSIESIEQYLDCKKLFEMLNLPYPKSTIGVINTLLDLRFISEQNTGKYTIYNLGALLLAKRLSFFRTVQYKAVRVLKYSGLDITQSAREQIGGKGYIVGFEGLIDFIMNALPVNEVLEGALRKQICDYPILSIRELVANALIHQDLNISGCPIISIFPDHIEITNPGKPLIAYDRFIDNPPCSRNEALAAAMHRVGICEERGSGYDKVISYIEQYNLPAPKITEYDQHTKVTLFAKKSFESLTKEERTLACYNHACLNYVQGKITNNTSLRSRFQLDEDERYKISRVFNDTMKENLIKAKKDTGTKNREYVPYWAD